MATETELCNQALLHIGHSTISDVQADTSREAELCRVFFPVCRDTLLRSFPWNFARRRVSLAQSGTPPSSWAYSYAMPTECLQVLSIVVPGMRLAPVDLQVPYEVASDGTRTVILCDLPDAELLYTGRVDNPFWFDSLFASVLSWYLATELAMPLAIKPELATQTRQTYMMLLANAQAQSLNEGFDHPPACEFMAIRGANAISWRR